MKFFGYQLIHPSEIEKIKLENKSQLEFLAKENALLERELTYYRKRADEERLRADRQLDSLMQDHGLPEVTAVGIARHDKAQEKAEEEFRKHQKEINEIFAETMNTTFDDEGLELPEEFREEAAKMVGKQE